MIRKNILITAEQEKFLKEYTEEKKMPEAEVFRIILDKFIKKNE